MRLQDERWGHAGAIAAAFVSSAAAIGGCSAVLGITDVPNASDGGDDVVNLDSTTDSAEEVGTPPGDDSSVGQPEAGDEGTTDGPSDAYVAPDGTPDGGSDGADGADGADGEAGCGANQVPCNGVCTDLSTDPHHCGSCAISCPVPANGQATCSGGTCGVACPSGETECGAPPGTCIDTTKDPLNCGSCGNMCSGGADSGVCVASSCRPWPFGSDGPLVIGPGQTVTLPQGSVADFSSLTIQNGGTLQVAPGSGWTYIGVSGDLVNDGTIVARDPGVGGTYASTAPDNTGALSGKGEALTYTIAQSAGGAGGGGGQSTWPGSCGGGGGGCGNGPSGGGQADGNGGGGGGGSGCWNGPVGYNGSGGATAVLSSGGNGGETNGSCLYPGGAGATAQMPNGSNGNDAAQNPGSGGGGGFRGYHGQGLYIKVWGSLSGFGVIDASGGPGGTGGSGAAGGAWGNQTYGGGGGGGGGAGGSGGKVVIRYGVSASGSAAKVGGGAGGSGGIGGNSGATNGGQTGSAGQNGATGSVDVQQVAP